MLQVKKCIVGYRVKELWFPNINNAQNPLHTFSGNFPVHGEVANLFQQVVVIEFGKRHDTTRYNGLLPAPTCYGLVVFVADLLRTCYGEVANLLRTNCYGETCVMDFMHKQVGLGG